MKSIGIGDGGVEVEMEIKMEAVVFCTILRPSPPLLWRGAVVPEPNKPALETKQVWLGNDNK